MLDKAKFGTIIFLILLFPTRGWAAFASQFTLDLSEQYNDNIFFSRNKESDFLTAFAPTLSLFYAPAGETRASGLLSVSSSGQFFANNSDLNNFGDNISANGSYSYQFSPRLSFSFNETFNRQGTTRTAPGFSEAASIQTGSTTSIPGRSTEQSLRDFVSRGFQLTNHASMAGSYLIAQDFSVNGFYSNSLTSLTDAGGREVINLVGARSVYRWRQDHNLHAGYSASINRYRDGKHAVVHNFDLGDDYFTNYNLQLSPTLSLTASSGLSVNPVGNGPRVANNTNITVTKLWETAVFNAGVKKGLTPSFGISEISDTTSLFATFRYLFTERLSTGADFVWSLYDTKATNFKTLQANLVLQYAVTTWLSTTFGYRFIGLQSSNRTDLLQSGTVNSNAVFLSLSTRFELWPTTGLGSRSTSFESSPLLKTPFPVQSSGTKTP